jgi:hypothetical protein
MYVGVLVVEAVNNEAVDSKCERQERRDPLEMCSVVRDGVVEVGAKGYEPSKAENVIKGDY